ncbi:MAG TPA: disulfide bond formation protein DsbD [Castellaniella sp.]|uniref:disulfide bond formation protein DsbD n=1 Tax=Castellaniella sp. TaxID=1955812 RepID=UPI002EEA70FC
MKSSNRRSVANLGAVVVLAGTAILFGWRQFSATHTEPATDNATAASSGIMDSSAHVTASVALKGQDGIVTLHIGKDWHVNANPASLENLIASTVMIEHNGSQRAAQAIYPPGKSSGITIDGTDILVYEDGTVIPVKNLDSTPGDHMLVRVQACNTQGICLAPAMIVATGSQI